MKITFEFLQIKLFESMTMLILFPEVSHEMPTLSKQEVANTSSKYDSQEEPSIESHHHQHE